MVTSIQNIWNAWNIRGVVLLSLSLQVLLTFVAPLRRSTRKGFVHFLVWSSYLMAQWTAVLGIGLISNVGGNESNDLLALWAPFLLLHLAGPDTISALALEDNQLWLRHLIGLVPQAAATFYVFLLSLPNNRLCAPAILIFVADVIRYLERTRALFLASLDRIQDSMLKEPDPGLNYDEIMEEYAFKREAGLPTQIIYTPDPGPAATERAEKFGPPLYFSALKRAYTYFNTFKGFLVDLIFSFQERNETRDFFRLVDARTALRVIELELNFIYEIMFTKALATASQIGYVLRFVSLAAVLGSLVFLSIEEAKKGFNGVDVVVTYALHVGVVTLDVMSIYWFMTSDWIVLKMTACCYYPLEMHYFLGERSSRWFESVSGHNLIRLCLKSRPQRIHEFAARRCLWHLSSNLVDFFGLRDYLDSFLNVTSKEMRMELWIFIYDELKRKSDYTYDLENAKRISLARGDWILRDDTETQIPDSYKEDLMRYVTDVNYDESLLLWHVATQLCYVNDNEDFMKTARQLWLVGSSQETVNNDGLYNSRNFDYRSFSRVLSDYMMYLLIMQPAMMSAVAGMGKIRFRDTCAAVEQFFSEMGLQSWYHEMLKVDTEIIDPAELEGNTSKSVLFDACILAKKLIAMEKETGASKWILVSKIWVEMLSYGAVNCPSRAHIQQLSKGGELITFVWLAMAHLGLRELYLSSGSSGSVKFADGTTS